MGFFSAPKSYQTSDAFSGLDPAAQQSWDTLFTGAQQGVAPWQQAGFNQAMSQALSHFSGLDAARGGQTPFSLPQIASSAAQYTVPLFAQMNTNLLGNLLGQRQISRSTGRGTQTGAGIGYNWANSFGNNLFGEFGKKLGGGGGTAVTNFLGMG